MTAIIFLAAFLGVGCAQPPAPAAEREGDRQATPDQIAQFKTLLLGSWDSSCQPLVVITNSSPKSRKTTLSFLPPNQLIETDRDYENVACTGKARITQQPIFIYNLYNVVGPALQTGLIEIQHLHPSSVDNELGSNSLRVTIMGSEADVEVVGTASSPLGANQWGRSRSETRSLHLKKSPNRN